MKKLLWSSDPTLPRDEREELARAAWMAAAEHLRPELAHHHGARELPATRNARIAEVRQINMAFEDWWRGQREQVDQCPYVIADKRDGYRHCELPKGHDGDHRTDEDHVALGASWCTPEQLAWRQQS